MHDEPPLRILLSPPDLGSDERELLLEALDSNWIAPVGPQVDAFERELAAHVGASHGVALSSGTAALHLALRLSGVGPGDEVLCPTMTFVATANAVRYLGARPVFVDVDAGSWNLDVDLVRRELETAAAQGRRYAAVIAVDLYGRCCDYDALTALCRSHDVPLVEDAAEALGSTYKDRSAGTFGDIGVLSFNGNKIITTSGGGMLLTEDAEAAARARFLATQARDPAPHYEHSELGYNYRLSNLLAAVGRGQLRHLDEKVARRREIKARYTKMLADLPGVEVAADGTEGEPNNWLTCILVDPSVATASAEDLRRHLRSLGIEARPLWKPMHLQPAFADCRSIGGRVAERLFQQGLCLPSGPSLTESEQDEICTAVRSVLRA